MANSIQPAGNRKTDRCPRRFDKVCKEKSYINYLKYEFLSGKELAIYSTDEQALKHMKFPYSTWKIRTYSFKELRNVGCGNTFFMDDHTTPPD